MVPEPFVTLSPTGWEPWPKLDSLKTLMTGICQEEKKKSYNSTPIEEWKMVI